MDTRKLKADIEVTLHNDGRPEQWTEVVVDGGHPTMGYFDPPQAAEIVRRWNAYPELVAALEHVVAVGGDPDDKATLDDLNWNMIRGALKSLQSNG